MKILKYLLLIIISIFQILINLAFSETSKANFFPFEDKVLHKYGYIDKVGRVVIEPRFDYSETFKNGVSIFRVGNLYGFINEIGDIIEPQFYEIKSVLDDLLVVKDSSVKYGYFNKFTKKYTIQPYFDDAFNFSEGYAKIMMGNKYGYIDKTGKISISPRYDYSENFSDGIAWATFYGKDSTYINKIGHVVLKVKTDYILSYSEGLAVALMKGSLGYVDKTGKVIIKPQFEKADKFNNGQAFVRANGKWGIVDKTGSFILKPTFDEIKKNSNDLFAVRLGEKWGYIDKTGKVIIKPTFDFVENFSDDLALVKVDSKFGYIDKKGDFAIKPFFESAESFYNGLAKVDDSEYIDKSGKFVFKYESYLKNKSTKVTEKKEKNFYNLSEGTKVCVNHWSDTNGFCGTIVDTTERNYIINIESVNCSNKKCSGGCSSNPLNILSIPKKDEYFMSKGLYIISIPKDCITSLP